MWDKQYPTFYNSATGYSQEIQDNFFRMSTSEQLAFLKTEYNSVILGTTEAGTKAKFMRNQLKDCMNLDGLFYDIDGDEVFMNEELRDFLNINENGYDKYNISEMTQANGWYRMPHVGAKEHQHKLINNEANIKYVNIDGREAIFDSKNQHITYENNKEDAGTYNYGSAVKLGSVLIYGFTSDSSHGLYDMTPFFRQQQTSPSYWISVPDSYMRYGWQRELRGEW